MERKTSPTLPNASALLPCPRLPFPRQLQLSPFALPSRCAGARRGAQRPGPVPGGAAALCPAPACPGAPPPSRAPRPWLQGPHPLPGLMLSHRAPPARDPLQPPHLPVLNPPQSLRRVFEWAETEPGTPAWGFENGQ